MGVLERYLSIAKMNKYARVFLFKRIVQLKSGQALQAADKKLSYGLVRDLVKGKAASLGLCPSDFGTHSMRAGAATVAANSNIPERILQKHGRWATAGSKDRYVKDSLERRLEISHRLSGQPGVLFN